MFDFRFYEIWREPDFTDRLINGVWVSVELSTAGGVFGLIMGLALAAAQSSVSPSPLRYASISYIEAIRNTPFIVQLFFVTFGLPLIFNYRWPFEASALLAIVLNFSAYFAEVLRAGIESVQRGQIEAAHALCLTRRQTFFDIVLPQAFANVWPSLTSQFVFLFLTTGLISEIGVEDLTWSGRYIADRNFRDFEVFIILTLLYILIVFGYKAIFSLLKRSAFPWRVAR